MDNKVVLPVRLDSYTGKDSALEAFFRGSEEKSMWIAVWIVNGKVEHDTIDYGYRSLEDLLETYKGETVIGLRKSAALDEARQIAEDALGVLLATEDGVVNFLEGEIGLEDGAIKKAYKTLLKARKEKDLWGGLKHEKGAENREA